MRDFFLFSSELGDWGVAVQDHHLPYVDGSTVVAEKSD